MDKNLTHLEWEHLAVFKTELVDGILGYDVKHNFLKTIKQMKLKRSLLIQQGPPDTFQLNFTNYKVLLLLSEQLLNKSVNMIISILLNGLLQE